MSAHIEILNQFAGVLMDPKFSWRDTDAVEAAMRRRHAAAARAQIGYFGVVGASGTEPSPACCTGVPR